MKALVVISMLCAAQLSGAQGYTVPEAVSGVTSESALASGYRFLPFGWSADGKFAWLESRDVEGRGGTIYTYTIYDAVEDAVVYSRVDDSFDWGTQADAADVVGTEAESWKRSGAEVSAALAKFGIVQDPHVQVAAFPLDRAGDRYTAALVTRDDPTKDEADDDRISSYTLGLTSRARGSKQVTHQDKVGAATVQVVGYILSPKEPRILVVVSEMRRGFEGYDETLRFFGAHLGVGFRK